MFKGMVKPMASSNLVGDICSGFCAGAFGVALNCWTDVVRSVIQKEAIASTFDPKAVPPSSLQHFNLFHFLGKTSEMYAAKG